MHGNRHEAAGHVSPGHGSARALAFALSRVFSPAAEGTTRGATRDAAAAAAIALLSFTACARRKIRRERRAATDGGTPIPVPAAVGLWVR